MVNYVTPGYATAVYVSSTSVQRIRTTAESHRRIAIIEVMGRDCGMIALGTAYGQPDIILVPESPVDPDALVERVLAVLDIQKHAVIVRLGGRSSDPTASILGRRSPPARTRPATSSTPGRPRRSSGCWSSGSATTSSPASGGTSRPTPRSSSGRSATPSAAAGRSCSTASTPRSSAARRSTCCCDGLHNCVATLQYRDGGFALDSVDANKLRDRWGMIHARPLSPTVLRRQAVPALGQGVEYLRVDLRQRPRAPTTSRRSAPSSTPGA